MIPSGHISFPFLAVVDSRPAVGFGISPKNYFVLILFSVIVDFDSLIYPLAVLEKEDERWFDSHHHRWASHWPATYSFLFVILLFSPSMTVIMMIIGLYSTSSLTAYIQGMDHVADAFSRRYVKPLSEKTNGLHGMVWQSSIENQGCFKVEM